MSTSESATAFVSMAMSESWKDDLHYTARFMLEKDDHYTLFRSEDWKAWLTFTCVFIFLIIFDNVVMNRNPHALTMFRAFVYTMFWVAMAGCFCGWVYWYYDQTHALMWASGYMLEWMLSFDNLFVFHMIFNVYKTPDVQKHRALYLGICGAVFFRVIFIFVGEYLMHAMFFMHLVFGGFLIYTGVKTMAVDDEDEDPSQHPLVQLLQTKVPFVSAYDQKGAFFVKVPVDQHGKMIMSELYLPADGGESAPLVEKKDGKKQYGTVDFDTITAKFTTEGKMQTHATMLFLVVCCLEISDLLFAVDSVSAIVAQVPDLFLAYTSAVFAMLGLRAMFFIIDVMADLFTLLKYGVGIVLVFIGIKLCVGHWYHCPPSIVVGVLISAIAGSMIASVIKEKYFPDPESDDEEGSQKGSAKSTPRLSEAVTA